MPLISTRGAASAQGFGEFAQSAAVNYIEDVFSTYLYTGNGSTQTITNGIDLAGKGGLTWFAGRNTSSYEMLFDSARGVTKYLLSGLTNAEDTSGAGERLTAYNNNGFSLGTDPGFAVNASGYNYVSWTFRKQAKFFDVVTYTGNGVVGRSITHNLGSAPGCVMIKCTSSGGSFYGWEVWHRTLSNQHGSLNSTGEFKSGIVNGVTAAEAFGNGSVVVSPTSTVFTVGGYAPTNENGQTYVAYLFAHDAGGFGLSGTDNVISCGSYTGNGSATGPSVTLGWEPQWLLVKNATTAGREWFLMDNMRGFTANGTDAMLFPNNSNSESSQTKVGPTATGFQPLSASGDVNASGDTYIYIAIRRGPMKVPTSGTSVFKPFTYNNSAGGFTQTQNAGFPTDFAIESDRINPANHYLVSRLQGPRAQMASNSTLDEASYNTGGDQQKFDLQNLFAQQNSIDTSVLLYCFRRAPSFFDVVCYTGTGSANSVTHNLGVAPELMIVKPRSTTGFWRVYSATLGNTQGLSLNGTDAAYSAGTSWNSATPTSTAFSVNATATNSSGVTYVAYLFATVAGVSKVGSYTGSGTTKQIDCGFTAGARFVLIKRTDTTGDWYVYDSARGIVAGNDPYLFLNSTAAEVTSTDYVDTYSAGFELSSTAPAGLNANGGTYIFLAIA